MGDWEDCGCDDCLGHIESRGQAIKEDKRDELLAALREYRRARRAILLDIAVDHPCFVMLEKMREKVKNQRRELANKNRIPNKYVAHINELHQELAKARNAAAVK